MWRRAVLIILKEYLNQVYQERLEQVILFGSRARGDASIALRALWHHKKRYSLHILKIYDVHRSS
jgi:hypothetical protein